MPRILIVSDQISLRALVRQALESASHAVDEAASTQETVDALTDERIDLLIVDLHHRAGMDTIVVTRQMDAEVPIIAVSGRTTFEAAMDMGADIQIDDPFDLAELLTAVRWLLEGPRM